MAIFTGTGDRSGSIFRRITFYLPALLTAAWLFVGCGKHSYEGKTTLFEGDCSILENALRYTPRDVDLEPALKNMQVKDGPCTLLVARSQSIDAILLHNPAGERFFVELFGEEGIESLEVSRYTRFVLFSGYRIESHNRSIPGGQYEDLGINGTIYTRASGCAGIYPDDAPELFIELDDDYCEPSSEALQWLEFAMERLGP